MEPRVLFLSCRLEPSLLETVARLAQDADVQLIVASEDVEADCASKPVFGEWCDRVDVFPASQSELEPWLEDQQRACVHRCPEATGLIGELLAHDAVDVVQLEQPSLLGLIPDWVEVPVLLDRRARGAPARALAPPP